MADNKARSWRCEKEMSYERFQAKNVIRLMEDEEFSAWCDKNLTCPMTHLMKMTMKETSCRDGEGMLLTKF